MLKIERGKDGGIGGGQNGVGILRCHSEEFDKGGIFGGDQALPRGGSVISRKRGEF